MKTKDIDIFSKQLDEIFKQGMPTKAQIIDAYIKAQEVESTAENKRLKAIVEKQEEIIEHIGGMDLDMCDECKRLESGLSKLKGK